MVISKLVELEAFLTLAIEEPIKTSKLQFQSLDIWLPTLNAEQLQAFKNAASRSNASLINLAFNHFDKLDNKTFESLCDVLNQFKKLQSINLEQNQLWKLTRKNFQLLCNFLQKSKVLKTLNLSDNSLAILEDESDMFNILCNMLSQFKNLETLNLANNSFDTLQGPKLIALGNALIKCPRLQTILLSKDPHATMSATCFQLLCTSLQNLETFLNVISNNIDEERLVQQKYALFMFRTSVFNTHQPPIQFMSAPAPQTNNENINQPFLKKRRFSEEF